MAKVTPQPSRTEDVVKCLSRTLAAPPLVRSLRMSVSLRISSSRAIAPLHVLMSLSIVAMVGASAP
eukprot:scaffold4717_cov274-Pinguiococcus_pyrenoidosus.AAC.3